MPPQMRGAFEQAYEFLLSVRSFSICDTIVTTNTLTWEAQGGSS